MDLNYILFCFVPSLVCLKKIPDSLNKKTRGFMSLDDKIEISNNITSEFKEIITGILLSDGSLRMNGNMALLSIQQTHSELTTGIWNICFNLNLVLSNISIINRNNWKTIYAFQTLTLPFFTELFKKWYVKVNGRNIKILPIDIFNLFTPLCFAYLIMGDGSWDSSGSRISLHLNNFTINEVKIIQNILLTKFQISSTIIKNPHSDPLRGNILRIPKKDVAKVRELTKEFIYPSLLYKIGL